MRMLVKISRYNLHTNFTKVARELFHIAVMKDAGRGRERGRGGFTGRLIIPF